MYCKHCSMQIPNGSVYCPECGANQMTENTPRQTDINTQPQNTGYAPNQPVYSPNPVPVEEDKSSVGMNILSFFFPIVGIIYYFCMKKEKPKKAKGTLKTAIISIAVSVVLSIIGAIIAFIGASVAIGGAISNGDFEGKYEYEYSAPYNEYHYSSDDANDDNYDHNEDVAPPAAESPTVSASQSDRTDVNASSKWTDYTVYINGIKVTIPMSYKDFMKATGCTLKDSDDAETTLKSNYYTFISVVDQYGKRISIEVYNGGSGVKTITECTVIGLTDYKHDSSDKSDIVFAGGLRAGDSITEAKLLELFGQPDKTWYSKDDADGDSFSYTYYENYDKYYSNREFVITVYDGIINDIEIVKVP